MTFWQECEEIAKEAAGAVVPVLLSVYLNKTAEVPGATPITLGNIGKIAGQVAASAVLQHIAIAQQSAIAPTSTIGSAPQK